MSLDLQPAALSAAVVWGGLAIGLALGAVGQASRFCVRGAIADWVTLRSPARMASWVLAIGVAAAAMQVLLSAGAVDGTRTIAWSDRFVWASYLVGGLLFGYGMVLSGGCPQRCLVKAGSGNLKAAVALLVIAVAAAMTLRGLFAAVRANGLDSLGQTLAGPQDLGSVLGRAAALPPGALRWVAAGLMLAAALAFAWRVRRTLDKGHWLGGIAVGLLVAAAFWLTGKVGFVAEHPETLEPAWLGTQSRRPEGLSFSAPMAHLLDLLTLWSDKNTVPTFGVSLAAGVLLGAFASAKWRGDFRLEIFSSPRELAEHALGGVLMGFGGITALGCSIGNGVTGLAMLSLGSLLAVAGICIGASLALRVQARKPADVPAGSTAALR
jgi:uncharacterized membrane protein YedE/YeeE